MKYQLNDPTIIDGLQALWLSSFASRQEADKLKAAIDSAMPQIYSNLDGQRALDDMKGGAMEGGTTFDNHTVYSHGCLVLGRMYFDGYTLLLRVSELAAIIFILPSKCIEREGMRVTIVLDRAVRRPERLGCEAVSPHAELWQSIADAVVDLGVVLLRRHG